MCMPFAHLLLLLAPVLNTNRLVGFHHVCDLELRIHLSEEEENVYEIIREVFCTYVCERGGRCDKWSFNCIL